MSDHIFAKLYEKDGRQVLVTKETCDKEGCPQIHFRTTTKNGHSATLKFSYEDKAWGKRDAAFHKVDEESAWNTLPDPSLLKL